MASRGSSPPPSRFARRRWRSADDCSPTTIPIPPRATTAWRCILYIQGKYALAQPLFEKALEIDRRLLSDDHRHTAIVYNNLASNLKAQGKYAQAQPLFEKALEITRRILTDDHSDTATNYNNLANNLNAQGMYALAQPLHETGAGDPPPPSHRRPPPHHQELQ